MKIKEIAENIGRFWLIGADMTVKCRETPVAVIVCQPSDEREAAIAAVVTRAPQILEALMHEASQGHTASAVEIKRIELLAAEMLGRR